MVVVARCRASGVCISSDTKVVYVRMTCLISTRIVIPGRRWGVDPFRQRVGAEFLLEVCAVSSGSQKRLYGIESAVWRRVWVAPDGSSASAQPEKSGDDRLPLPFARELAVFSCCCRMCLELYIPNFLFCFASAFVLPLPPPRADFFIWCCCFAIVVCRCGEGVDGLWMGEFVTDFFGLFSFINHKTRIFADITEQNKCQPHNISRQSKKSRNVLLIWLVLHNRKYLIVQNCDPKEVNFSFIHHFLLVWVAPGPNWRRCR